MLKIITPPAIEPVTVSDVKLYCHIDYDTEDTIIEGWIKAGRETAENYQRRAYIRQTWELSEDGFPITPILIPRPPLAGIQSIKYYDYENTETTMDLTDFIIDTSSIPGRVMLGYNIYWPSVTLRSMDSFKLRFIAGYDGTGIVGTTTTLSPDADEVPQYIKDAIMLYCAYRYENRAGEVTTIPEHFYNLLRQERCYY